MEHQGRVRVVSGALWALVLVTGAAFTPQRAQAVTYTLNPGEYVGIPFEWVCYAGLQGPYNDTVTSDLFINSAPSNGLSGYVDPNPAIANVDEVMLYLIAAPTAVAGTYPVLVNGTGDGSANSCDIYVFPQWPVTLSIIVTDAPAKDDEDQGKPECSSSAGNPINPSIGNKYQVETDFAHPLNPHLSFRRHYNSHDGLWRHSLHSALTLETQATEGQYRDVLRLRQADGRLVTLRGSLRSAPGERPPTDNFLSGWKGTSAERITQDTGSEAYYRVTHDDARIESYDSSGALRSIEWPDGIRISVTQTPTSLRWSDQFGRWTEIEHPADNPWSPNLLRTDDGRIWQYGYDEQGRLISVTLPDDTGFAGDNPSRQYQYENAGFPNALTGIVDETGQLYAVWAYDSRGRATYSGHGPADADGLRADETRFEYHGDGTTTVTEYVSGTQARASTYTFTEIDGYRHTTNIEGEATLNCPAAGRSMSYDPNGLLDQVTDWEGHVTDYDFDARGQELQRTEALGSPVARTVSTQWHPKYRLPVQRTEPGKTTLWDYGDDALVDTVTESDTTSWNSGTRSWQYQYYPSGLLQSVDGPRTDAQDITTYEYNGRGELVRVTDALGHASEITTHTLGGLPETLVDPNGVVTELGYTARGWLSSITVDDTQQTRIEYADNGLVRRITEPDGAWLDYEYDGAQRLVAIENRLGERHELTLNLKGGRELEQIKRPNDSVLYQHERRFDEIGRVLRELGMNGQDWQYGYDRNDNPTSELDANGNGVVRAYDALNRLERETDAYHDDTGFAYDGQDHLSTITDPNGNTTRYDYDGLGNLRRLTSPDTGITTYGYDSAGNRTTQVDARGVVTEFEYDALNRLVERRYPGSPSENASFGYDDTSGGNHGVGRLTRQANDGGSSSFIYDAYGNLLRQTDTVEANSYTTQYDYDADSYRLMAITYPSGRIVQYQRDTLGRIDKVQMRNDASLRSALLPTTIVKNLDYLPFGPLARLKFGNNVETTLTHDLDYRVQRIVTGTTGWFGSVLREVLYDYGLANEIESLDATDDRFDAHYTYDGLYRLSTADDATGQWSFGYDANGNRLERNWTPTDGSSTTQSLTYRPGSNGLDTLDGDNVTLDAAGNLAAHGNRSYRYNHANRWSEYRVTDTLQASFRYNASGQRVAKQSPSLHTEYQYLPDGRILSAAEYANGNLVRRVDYLWLDHLPVAQHVTVYGSGTPTTRLTYLHADHLATPRLMTDSSKAVVWRWEADAFGQTPPDEDPDQDGAADRLDLRFPGQIADAETGSYYNYFRDYDPGTGRYLQSDPIGLAGGINTYSYVGGNPVSFVDPLGLAQTVCFYPTAANGFGHIGIGPSSSSTSGFYPAPGNSTLERLHGPGAVLPDTGKIKDETGKSCTTIETTQEQDAKINDYIGEMAVNPGSYNFFGRNCAGFVEGALSAGGVPVPGSINPGVVYDYLSGQHGN